MYLIAHKYCGELTFDVATQLEDGAWILNDGHIAYPFWHVELKDLLVWNGQGNEGDQLDPGPMPPDAIDAYPEPKAAPTEKPQALRGLLTKIGLVPKLERRL